MRHFTFYTVQSCFDHFSFRIFFFGRFFVCTFSALGIDCAPHCFHDNDPIGKQGRPVLSVHISLDKVKSIIFKGFFNDDSQVGISVGKQVILKLELFRYLLPPLALTAFIGRQWLNH